MEETLEAMPLVLDDPAPRVYFVGFGDSSLDFNLYVYSRQLSDRMPLKHAVHDEIWAALRKNGIEIPFPQRDLYVKSLNIDDAKLRSGKQAEDES
jgi:potassium efflux system protein